MTYSGSFVLPDTGEVMPRTLSVAAAPGLPELCCTNTPFIAPPSILSMVVAPLVNFSMSSAVTEVTALVTSRLDFVP